MGLSTVKEAVDDIRKGKMVIVIDEEHRENEGDLTIAAEKITPEIINFMAQHGRGLICMPMTGDRLDKLKIPLMVKDNESSHGTAFCISIEARQNVSTGISAADRAMTILTAADLETRPEDLIKPGHVFPLRARKGGVLKRAGQTEAAVDLVQIAGLTPAGVICEIMNEDGTMARLPDLELFAKEHDLLILSVVDLIKFRLSTEKFVRCIGNKLFSSELGDFDLRLFRNELDGDLHLAFVKGDVSGEEPVMVRVHKESVVEDVFLRGSSQVSKELRTSLKLIQQEGRGVLVYLRLNDRDGSLLSEFEHQGDAKSKEDKYPMNFRSHGLGAQILVDLGLRKIRLLTNHPKKLVSLDGFDLTVVEQLPIEIS